MKLDIKAFASTLWRTIRRYFTKPWFLILLALLFTSTGLIYKYASEPAPPSGIYIIALDPTWNPLPLYGREERITVFSEELVRAIAEEEHLPYEIKEVTTENLFFGLNRGDVQGVLSTQAVLAESMNFEPQETSIKFPFSKSYYHLGPLLVVSTASHIDSLKDLEGKRVGIITSAEMIPALYKDPLIDFHYYDYPERAQMVEDVSNHVLDAMVLNTIPAYQYTRSGLYRGKLKIASTQLAQNGLRLFVDDKPESHTLLIKFNRGLEKIKKNGTYERLLQKWGLYSPD